MEGALPIYNIETLLQSCPYAQKDPLILASLMKFHGFSDEDLKEYDLLQEQRAFQEAAQEMMSHEEIEALEQTYEKLVEEDNRAPQPPPFSNEPYKSPLPFWNEPYKYKAPEHVKMTPPATNPEIEDAYHRLYTGIAPLDMPDEQVPAFNDHCDLYKEKFHNLLKKKEE